MNSPIEFYNQNGFLKVSQFFSESELENISSAVNPVFKKWFSENAKDISRQGLVNMHSLSHEKYYTELPSLRVQFFNTVCSKRFVKFLKSLFGENIFFNNTQLFFNPANSSKKAYWHRDLQYSPISIDNQRYELKDVLTLHARVPLVPETGIELIPGTHRRWDTELESNVRYQKDGFQCDQPLPESREINLVPGDLLIFNAQMLHKGIYHKSVERKALDICFGTHHPLLEPFISHEVLPGKEELKKVANKEWYPLKN